jgi:hypothetical protein
MQFAISLKSALATCALALVALGCPLNLFLQWPHLKPAYSPNPKIIPNWRTEEKIMMACLVQKIIGKGISNVLQGMR